VFFSTVDGGRSVSSSRKSQRVFSQGGSADSVFYIQKGKAKVSSPSRGKEAVVAFAETETSSARAHIRRPANKDH
jgi:CRP/FNR family cyclic AMP-dependent transcriptional regulator